MKLPDGIFDSLPRLRNKIKVNLRKIIKTFDPYSGVAKTLAEIIDDKKWRSAWLIINPDKHS